MTATLVFATARVLDEVANERDAQDLKWGQQNHDSGTGPRTEPLWRMGVNSALSATQLAEYARTFCDTAASAGDSRWLDIFLEEVFEALAETEESGELREELIQVAAVAVAWIECIDRRQNKREENAA